MKQCDGCGEEIHLFHETSLALAPSRMSIKQVLFGPQKIQRFHNEDCLRRLLLRKTLISGDKPE